MKQREPVKRYGMGRIFSRGRGEDKRLWIAFNHRGREYRESTGGNNAKAARDLLRQRLGEVASGRVVGPVADKLTLKDLLDMVAADHALNKRRSKAPTARIVEHFGESARALDLDHAALTRYAGQRIAAGAKAATVRNEIAAVGRGLTLAVKAGKLAQRPSLPSIRLANARSGFVEPADFAKLLAHLPRYLQPLAEVAYVTGWRRGELINLRWRNVDWAAGELRLERGSTKSGEPRVFPFAAHPRLAALLKEQHARVEAIQRERGFIIAAVFVHDDGQQVAGWWQDSWATAAKAIGRPDLLFHDLRRSAVRNLVRAGVSETVAMRLSGHATASVFRRYNIVSGDDLTAAVKKLAHFHATGGEVATGRVLAMPKRARRRA